MSAADRRKYRKPNIADAGRDYDDRDAEITRLRAELARAKSCACADCNTEILQLRAENEALNHKAQNLLCVIERLRTSLTGIHDWEAARNRNPADSTSWRIADAALAAKGDE